MANSCLYWVISIGKKKKKQTRKETLTSKVLAFPDVIVSYFTTDFGHTAPLFLIFNR